MTRARSSLDRLSVSGDAERSLGETTLRRLCELVEGLHPDDKKELLNRLAGAVLAETDGKVAVTAPRGSVVGYLVSMGEYAGLTATPEQEKQLDEAIGAARRD